MYPKFVSEYVLSLSQAPINVKLYRICHRTLQIFAYSGCIPFLLNNRLNQSGTFLVHGLKKDALYDMSQGKHVMTGALVSMLPRISYKLGAATAVSSALADNLDNAIKALHVPPSLDDAQQATSDHDSIDAVFRVLVEVQLEDEVANDIQRDDDVDKDSDSKMSSHQVLDHVDIARSLVLAVPCHPEDSVEALRLRLYDLRRRQNSSTDERFQDGKDGSSISGSIRGNSNYSSLNDFEGRWELPIGFEICRAPVGIAEGVRRAPEVSRSTPWLPFKHASLLAALRAARCDTSGRLPTLLRAPQQVQQLLPLAPHKTRVHASDSAESLPVSADEEIGNSHDSQPLPCNETRLRTPLLQPHGSPGLPLRRTALASSLGIDHDCGVQGCAHRFCCQDNRKLSLPPSNNLAMRSMSAESCPLTGVEGLVFLGVSP